MNRLPVNMEAIRNVLWHAEQDPNARAPLGTPELRGLVDLVDAQTGALIDVEWSAEFGGNLECCPRCERVRQGEAAGLMRSEAYAAGMHVETCSVDAALTLAGFPDQPSRDAERARRAGR
jgi:hypothetical protein